jgi:MFS family permease
MKEKETIPNEDMKLFWACFVALTTTSFGFILRSLTLPDWGREFNLTNTQIGEIAGVGLWPFAISIVLFSLIIDKVGYKTIMAFGFACHVASAILTFFASGYWSLFIATFLVAIGNGTVEAVINPVVATLFNREKTKWLNILHGGWPAGLVLGGCLALMLGNETHWKLKMILILLPTIAYGLMILTRKFPVNERVKAGVSYLEMLREVGIGGAIIVTSLVVFEIGSIVHSPFILNIIIVIILISIFSFFIRTIGQPVFIMLVMLMIPLAITELGTDSWITELMAPQMKQIGIQSGWIIIYTSSIMMVLRFFAGPIAHKLSPLGLLAISSAIACAGLILFSVSTGIMILAAATLFALGKTFFWPTMLAVVSERFPKGGALTINITGGVGMMAAGVIGAVILGFAQDTSIDKRLHEVDPSLHAIYSTAEKESIFGTYRSLDTNKLNEASDDERSIIGEIQELAKKDALGVVAIFPVIMLISYIALILYYRSNGGYTAVVLESPQPVLEEVKTVL